MLADVYRRELERAVGIDGVHDGGCEAVLAHYDARIEEGDDPADAAYATCCDWAFTYAPLHHFGYVAATSYTVEGEVPF